MNTIASPHTAALNATDNVIDLQYALSQYRQPNLGTGLSRACALILRRASRLSPACRGSLQERAVSVLREVGPAPDV